MVLGDGRVFLPPSFKPTVFEKVEMAMVEQTISKIKTIDQKINLLKEKQQKLKSKIENKIINILNQHNIMEQDFATLVGGILYVVNTLNQEDKESQEICLEWKGTGSKYIHKNVKNNIKSLQ